MLWALGFLVLGQGLVSLRSALAWLAFIRRSMAISPGAFTPPVTLIVPCRGSEEGLPENLAAYAAQDYPDYELLLVTSGPADPASAIAGSVPKGGLVYAAPRNDEGEKVSKLRAAVRAARPDRRILVFADSDGSPDQQWLRLLVAPLAAPTDEVGATTGYRWYMPPAAKHWDRLPALVRAVWNSFHASLLGERTAIFCWGGSMALRRQTFEQLEIDRCWQGSVSDDYQLSRALQKAGLPIRFVPACLVPNHSTCGWRELFAWTTRQIIITRVYAPGLWKLGLLAHGLYCLGIGALLWKSPSPSAFGLLAGIAAVSVVTGLARAAGAAAAMPAHRAEITARRWAFGLLAPLIPLLMLTNFVAAGFTRTIHWRGTSYELIGPRQTRVLGRSEAVSLPSAKSAAASGLAEDA